MTERTQGMGKYHLISARFFPAIISLIVLELFFILPGALNDSDTLWHIAAGQWMLTHQSVTHQDVFSFTVLGRKWINPEWLSEVIMAVVYGVGGHTGVQVLFGLTISVTTFLVLCHATRDLDALGQFIIGILTIMIMSVGYVARPHLFGLLVLAIWMSLLLDASARGTAPPLYSALLMLAWTNLHSSFILGIMLIVPFAVESVLRTDRRAWNKVALGWGIFGFGATIASLINPNGVDGVVYPIRTINMENIRYIQEWQPSNFSHFGAFELGLLAVIGSGLYLGAHLSLPRLLVLLGVTHMALNQFRHQFIFGLVACMLLSPAIAVAQRKRQGVGASEIVKPWRSWYPWAKDPAVLMFGCLVLIFVAVRTANPVSLTESITRPVSALAAVPAELKEKPVFNDYGMAGYLIFSGVRPYIDGRSELYGDVFMKEFVQAAEAAPADLFTLFKRHDIQWTLLLPESPINKVLARYPADWALLHTDRHATVFRRTSPY